MSFYLYLNLAIILFPLAFSFERRLRFYSKMKPLLIAVLLVGFIFVGWDIFATYRGHWSFNSLYVGETKLGGLPLEEILFFVTVSYSCLFVFESIRYFLGDKKLLLPTRWLLIAVGLIFAISAFGFLDREYTFLAILSVGITLLAVSVIKIEIFFSRAYWIYIIATLFLFLIFNYILTSLPVVEYSSVATCGIRFATIPLEDFSFNFSMLTAYLTAYLWVQESERWK